MNIQKLIAREGMVILTIVILILLSLSLPATFIVKDTNKPINETKEKAIEITNASDNAKYTIVINKSDITTKVRIVEYTQADILKELGKRGKLESVENLNIIKKEISLISFKNKLLVLLLICYFSYFIYRFAPWAIGILKEK